MFTDWNHLTPLILSLVLTTCWPSPDDSINYVLLNLVMWKHGTFNTHGANFHWMWFCSMPFFPRFGNKCSWMLFGWGMMILFQTSNQSVILCSWRPEPLNICHHEWCHLLSSLPWTAQLRPSEIGSQSYTIPTASLLYGWFCPTHISWITAIPCPYRSRTHPTNVGC